MARNRGGLLARIAEDVADQSVPLSSLLQSCILLGGQAGSEKMRAWASQEMHGYAGAETVPEYRHVASPLTARITNKAGRNPITQRIDDTVFDPRVREMIREKVDVHDAIIPFGIGRLEEMANEDADVQWLSPEWAGFIADMLNKHHMDWNSQVSDVYWSVPRSAIRGILVRIRTALAELVAELTALTPDGQEVPDRQAADQVVQFIFTGDRSVLNYTVQQASGGGTNVAAAAGPVTMAGENGTAIGSQSASGENSSVVGTQVASGGRGQRPVNAGRPRWSCQRPGHGSPSCRGQGRLVGPAAEAGRGRRVRHHRRRHRGCCRGYRGDSAGGWLEAVTSTAACGFPRPWSVRCARTCWRPGLWASSSWLRGEDALAVGGA